MMSRIIGILALLALAFAPAAMAEGESALWMPPGMGPVQETPPEPVALVYFTAQAPQDQQRAASIRQIVGRANDELGLKIHEYALSDESKLAETVDKIAESHVGLVVIAAPLHRETVARIPSLYPDIRFSIIGLDPPEYYPNGYSVLFKEHEGLFLIGALAAWHSKSGIVKFCSSEDTPYLRSLLDAFTRGARYARPDVEIIEALSPHDIGDDRGDIMFLYDENNLQAALREARQQKHLLITYEHNLSGEYPGLILTTLIKRYDLAIYSALKTYQQNQWKAGSQSLGISAGYMDYTLSSNNNTLISEDIIDKLETLKDRVAQGTVKIAPVKN